MTRKRVSFKLFCVNPKIILKNISIKQPVSIGVPVKKGELKDTSGLSLVKGSKNYPAQFKALSCWPDKSIKWLLVDFIADQEGTYEITKASSKTNEIVPHIPKIPYKINIIGKKGHTISFKPDKFSFVEHGPVKWVFLRENQIVSRKQDVVLNIFEYLTFYPLLNCYRLDITIRNPRRAKHKGGYWDLGDPGSIYLKDFSLIFEIPKEKFLIKTEPTNAPVKAKKFSLYQESSGGENWLSRNHVNRLGEVPIRMRGFLFAYDDNETYGLRANPVIRSENFSLAVKEFWQNFPKVISYDGTFLRVGLFPEEFPDLHEIQGGEQKTHTIFFAEQDLDFTWVNDLPNIYLDPDYIKQTCAIFCFLPSEELPSLYKEMIESAVAGPTSFFAKREIIDEFGWRNFGDIYADHENVFNKGKKPIISHYNNQYDLIYSCLVQFLSSASEDWFILADALARHVYDIDIYHTNEDKPAYNNGLFWHTFHYVDAYRSTHRCYSKDAGIVGGGPSNEHLYSSGLLLHYFLTGDPRSKEAVISFAEHVIDMDKPYKIFAWFDKTPSGLATQTRDPWYHGPGRGAGNSINCLLDAFLLTHEKRYLLKAEEFIRRSIHPEDNQDELGLLNPEERWSYTVFLQVLGKYLLLKKEWEEFDFMFSYARASLIHYARWMAGKEYFYLDKPELLEYPTETWAAQEIRKAEVFNLAAYFTNNNEEKELFRAKAKYFYEISLKRLLSFPTWHYTRPLAIILQSGFSYPWFKQARPEKWPEKKYNFGKPQVFIPQKIKIKRFLSLKWVIRANKRSI